MKIQKGHYVPKELITSDIVHEAVVKCFVAAGFEAKSKWCSPNALAKGIGLAVDYDGLIAWLSVSKEPLNLQQLFTAENGLQWPDWADRISVSGKCVAFEGLDMSQAIVGNLVDANQFVEVLVTRQPKEKEVKAIENAVIAMNGKWSVDSGDADHLRIEQNMLFSEKPGDKQYICTIKEFESEAKRLGYIKGYKYMKEYTEKGKPNLPDDVMVSVMTNGRGRLPAGHVGFWNWHSSEIKSFRIVDERYKPADTSYLEKASEAERFGIMPPMNINERCDLNNWHERGELPPVGVVCNYRKGAHQSYRWLTGEIKYISKFITVVRDIEDGMDVSLNTASNLFKPIRTEREKVIEAAVKVMQPNLLTGTMEKWFGKLYDAGMLVMPK